MCPGDNSCRGMQGKTEETISNVPSSSLYRISVQGFVDESWSDRMNGVEIRVQDLPDEAPVTVLTGHFIDQAALAGALSTLYDLGYPLLKVELLEPPPLRNI
jgi:hypothetical protein